MNRENEQRNQRGAFDRHEQKDADRGPNDAESKDEDIEYPLREPGDRTRFFLMLGVLPAFATAVVAFIFALLLFRQIAFPHLALTSLLHFLFLIFFFALLWWPVYLAVLKWPERAEMITVILRSGVLVLLVFLFFPHSLVRNFFAIATPQHNLFSSYNLAFAAVALIYLGLTYYSNRHTAVRELRMALEPLERRYTNRLLWLDALSIFLTLFAVIVIEIRFLATMGKGQLDCSPYQILEQTNDGAGSARDDGKSRDSFILAGYVPSPILFRNLLLQDSLREKQPAPQWPETLPPDTANPFVALPERSSSLPDTNAMAASDSLQQSQKVDEAERQWRILAWFCGGVLCALVFVLSACLPAHLMKATLIPVTFHERDVEGVFFKSYRYLGHFLLALLLKNPILVPGSFSLTMLFFAAPIVLFSVGRFEVLNALVQADEIILVLGVFLAWFIPLSLAVVRPDETFGEYFNHRLANHIMMVQGHLVFIGHGDLGKRVLDREISHMYMLRQESGSRRRDKMFLEVVTPDLRLEQLCSRAVVLEHSPQDVIYSGTNSLLGDYGVVSTYKRSYKSLDFRGKVIHPERRLLVPIVLGEAKDPFIGSRVNLERASLIISMVPDEESVQAVFARAVKANVCSIICVTRSDQISYLTYRSRHRPIVLVYPKHNQGITLGQRLWAAILKVRAVRRMFGDTWPSVLVIGNNKANHYMLETLWTNLPGGHEARNKILQEQFSFIITEPEHPFEYPKLKDSQKQEAFDQYWPALYITGGRYPYPPARVSDAKPLHVPTRVINAADISALENCLKERQPDILVMNHEDVDKSLLMLSRCMRALERLKTSKPATFEFPLLLLSAARGDELEQLSLGDATHYYDALCKLHQEDLTNDASYPGHARYDHLLRELIGESISDSHADDEEIISGTRNSFLDPAKPQFVEINGCLPNRPGALANYVAKLGGIDFAPKSKADIDTLWRQANPLPAGRAPRLPSFQYLRNIMMDPERNAFALTGYASLAPLAKDSPALNEQQADNPLIVRVFANDGRNYIEPELDQDEWQYLKDEPPQLSSWRKPKDPAPPGVPQVIDRLTARQPDGYNSVGAFRQVMLDPKPDNALGKYACPGMTICRIAAFQDYVAASNSLRLQRLTMAPKNCSSLDKLFHARNYYCCAKMRQAADQEVPQPDTPYARLFCCCRGSHDPGMIAMVLNTLLFRSNFTRQAATGDPQKDWVINIDYFKDISCQNPHFALNRLFGFYAKKPPAAESGKPLSLPLHLLRILPIGAVDSARQWFYYARTLHYFLNSLDGTPKYKFYWLDEKLNRWDGSKVPEFHEKPRRDFPVVLVIKRERSDEERHADPKKFCHLCGVQPKEYDCRKLRVWV